MEIKKEELLISNTHKLIISYTQHDENNYTVQHTHSQYRHSDPPLNVSIRETRQGMTICSIASWSAGLSSNRDNLAGY